MRPAGVDPGTLLGSIVYWGVLLVFVAAATDVLGLPLLAAWLGAASSHLPRVLLAVLIVIAGFVGGTRPRRRAGGRPRGRVRPRVGPVGPAPRRRAPGVGAPASPSVPALGRGVGANGLPTGTKRVTNLCLRVVERRLGPPQRPSRAVEDTFCGLFHGLQLVGRCPADAAGPFRRVCLDLLPPPPDHETAHERSCEEAANHPGPPSAGPISRRPRHSVALCRRADRPTTRPCTILARRNPAVKSRHPPPRPVGRRHQWPRDVSSD